jgi:hypothetical protein
MKKVFTTLVVLLVALSIGSAAFAVGKNDDKMAKVSITYVGPITAIDKDKKLITLTDESKETPQTVIVKGKALSKFKVGDRVKVVLGRDTNVARTIILEPKN